MNNRKRWTRVFITIAALTSFATSTSAIEEACRNQSATRFALVIGHAYEGARTVSGRLDAEVVAGHLCQLGFSVDLVLNATLEQLKGSRTKRTKGAISDFSEKIAKAQEVTFFYSGHGYQIGEKNYLLPNDQEIDFEDPQFPLSKVLDALKNAPSKSPKIVFLDACRTLSNPPANLKEQGLAETPDLPPTTLLSFAAEYGHSVPSGRGGQLSPYSDALARSIREPGLELDGLLARVNQEVAATQTPVKHAIGFPDGFLLKPAIELPLTVADDINDQLLIFHNGTFVLAAGPRESGADVEEQRSVPLKLAAGKNELLLMMFNAKTFQDRQPWQPTDGWKYGLEVTWPADTQKNCEDPCFHGEEKTPFKSGPHHGQIFEVAKAMIYVDPGTWSVKAEVNNALWKEKPKLLARDQELLWEQSFDQLRLEERPNLKKLVRAYGTLKEILRGIELTRMVALPELHHLWAQVYGNGELRESIKYCMELQREARLDDLEAGLKAFIEDSNPRPFDQFDRKLSTCVQDWVSHRPNHLFFGQTAQIWTALEEKEAPSSAPSPIASPN